MKHLFNFLFKCILAIVVVAPLVTIPAQAVDTNALVIDVSCGDGFYSVDRITGYNQFTTLGCYPENKFTDAMSAMKLAVVEGPNVVVRHNSSNSPLNIVAADRAMAYSQNATYIAPFSATMSVFKDKGLSVPYTYINQENPLYYFGTEIKSKASTEIITPSDLVVEIEINGAHGYVPLNGVDIIPLIYVENRNNNWLVSFTRRTVENTYYGTAIKPNITHYKVAPTTIKTISGDVSKRVIKVFIDTAVYAYSLELGTAPDWLADGTYYSANGIEFFTDMDLKNPVINGAEAGRYYNYYQYLNLRSKTNYTGAELDAYYVYNGHNSKPSILENQGDAFINAQNNYGMNALLIYAMGIHESAYGTSGYAINYKNLFGYGAYDDNPDNIANYSYTSVEDCVNQQMGLNLRHYLDVNNFNAAANNSLFYASNIGNKGAGVNTRYASDPWWSVKIAN